MERNQLKNRLAEHAGECMAALLLIQPLLDVLSYFMQRSGLSAVTTALRLVLLLAVCAYGLVITENRRVYYILYGVIAGYWLAHGLNCLRLGYADPVADGAEYLKLVQFPLWTLVFVSFFRSGRELDLRAAGLLAANFSLVLLVIGLSFAVGMPVYTYTGIEVGILGWFAVPNAQSAVVSMLVMGLLLWAWRRENLWLFWGAAALGFGLLYATATRLAYYSAILTAAGLLVLILIAGKGRRLHAIPLVVVLVLLFCLWDRSPMTQRRTLAANSYEIYQSQSDRIMGEDRDFIYTGGELPEDVLEKIWRVYEEVYTQTNKAGDPLLGDLLGRFGTDRVMEAYRYSVDAETLYHTRTKKLTVMRLTWEEQDPLTRLLGFEYAHSRINGNTYDPENDFPALLYYYGWLGAGLYGIFAGSFLWMALWAVLRHIRELPLFLTVDLGVYTMLLALGLGAAQFSGNVMRRPSVTVYMSLAAAELYGMTRSQGKLFAHYHRRAEVRMKKLS